jgi:hypothetical protein
MRIWKIVFSVLTVVFGSIGLMKLLPYDITLPIMFVFMGLVMSLNAKECYDKKSKTDASIFGGVAIFVYAVTAFNLVSRLL